ncbi:MAG: hypothetical protein QOC78_1575 [Solirubrobacteraceae bacterium]|jgi:hypothetical protein|nr:hypothetical protein [Solirubrobacteraceae bacterium]
MRRLLGLATWRHGLALATLAAAAAASAALGATFSQTAARHPIGVRALTMSASAPLATLMGPGLLVRVEVASGSPLVRLRLLRRASGPAVASRLVHTRGRHRLVLALRPSGRARRHISAGSYVVEARAERSRGHGIGAPRRAPVALTAGSTTSAPPSSAPSGGGVVVAAAGDVACPGVCGQADTARIVTQTIRPQYVLGLGDYQYDTGTLPNFAANYDPYWGQFKNITYPINGGLHDFFGTGDYLTYFNAGGPVALQPEASYSFDIGSWHVVALNSYCFERSSCDAAQWTAWLKQDLAAHPARCTLAYYHEPYWTSPSHHPEDTALRPWIQALYDAGADVVLQGHNHLYERFAPQSPDSQRDDARGIVAFTVGTGGDSHYPFDGPPVANSLVRDDSTWGVLRLVLRPDGYDFQFIPVPGATFTDSGSGTCH